MTSGLVRSAFKINLTVVSCALTEIFNLPVLTVLRGSITLDGLEVDFGSWMRP